MKQSFSDINVEISQILNRTMHEFDEMPGVSGSLLVESSSRDLQRISANFRGFRLVVLVLLVIVLWKISDLSIVISAMLAWTHIFVAPEIVLTTLLVLLFVGSWVAFFKYLIYAKKRNFESMSEIERGLVQNVRTLADVLPENCGMLAQNFRGLAQRMIRVFASRKKRHVSELTYATQFVLNEDVCHALALNDDCANAVKRLLELLSEQRAHLEIAG